MMLTSMPNNNFFVSLIQTLLSSFSKGEEGVNLVSLIELYALKALQESNFYEDAVLAIHLETDNTLTIFEKQRVNVESQFPDVVQHKVYCSREGLYYFSPGHWVCYLCNDFKWPYDYLPSV